MSTIEPNTPLFKQYLKFKRQFPEHIIFYRMGDFYEMFGEDAVEGAKILGIALTSRTHGKSDRVPLAGVPYHAAERYLAKLAAAGKKVVICEQVEDPRFAKGIVKRDVVEILTPGTLMLEGALADNERNFLVGVVGPPAGKGTLQSTEPTWGVASADVTTGAFLVDECAAAELTASIAAWNPRELVVPESLKDDPLIGDLGVAVTTLPDWRFAGQETTEVLQRHFGTVTLSGFGFDGPSPGVRAAGGVLFYLRDTKKAALAHITGITRVVRGETMALDGATIRNLELLANRQTGNRAESVFGLLDHCATPMGRRLLRDWLVSPLVSAGKITPRLDAVEHLVRNRTKLEAFAGLMAGVFDLERFLGRLGTDRANARDLKSLSQALHILPDAARLFADAPALPKAAGERLPESAALAKQLDRALLDDLPLALTEGGVIRPGYSPELDELVEAIRDRREYLAKLQSVLRQETGIGSLKIGFNKVFGYYIEVTHPHKDKVPPGWIRKQTLVNAERYVTEEMKAAEELIAKAEERIFDLEYRLFLDLRETVKGRMADLKTAAEAIALWDTLASLAKAALRGNYVRPEVSGETRLVIRGGRHPIMEALGSAGEFVPNDTVIDHPGEFLHLLTGPNMAGKSTYLRQVGLLILLAQIGSFVPAESAEIGIVDRIFTRVGSADDLTRNQSTFMVEMTETATILNNATPRSLILFDEVGRGTSTYDGLAIAWSVAEHICRSPKLRCRTIFATHYHELTALAEKTEGAANYQMAVAEREGEVTFLYRVAPGGCDDSYGIYVARLAGVPRDVVERATALLADIEAGNFAPMLSQILRRKIRRAAPVSLRQASIFGKEESPVIKELQDLKVEELSPLEALNVLARLVQMVKS